MGKQHIECTLCGKTIVDQHERESSMLKEAIDGTSYTFDTNECAIMFKRFRSVYGNVSDFISLTSSASPLFGHLY
jgi:hypothetical protein